MAGTGLNEPGVLHPEIYQTEQEGTFPFQAGVNGFLHIDCMRIPKKKGTSYFQADVGVNPEARTPQIVTRQEFARLPKSWQQRGVIVWSTEQNKQFDPGR